MFCLIIRSSVFWHHSVGYSFSASFALIRSARSSFSIARTRNFFCEAVSPEISSICDFRTPSHLARTSTMALLALPFSGACVTQTFRAPSWTPRTSFRRAPGLGPHGKDGAVGMRVKVDRHSNFGRGTTYPIRG